jgi:hypothetical protein
MRPHARLALFILVAGLGACKNEPKPEPPLDDPCALYCQRAYECCTSGGLGRCDIVEDLCRSDCEGKRTDCLGSGIDFDAIATCMDATASCYQLVGLDEEGLARTYGTCLADEVDCPYVGTCPTDGETHCCEGSLATCRYGAWRVRPCESVCLDTGEVYADVCDPEVATESCLCAAAPHPCTLYCEKGIAFCEERDWQGCADEGIESCSLLQPACQSGCDALGVDMQTCGIDSDAVTRCMWRYLSPEQILGCDPSAVERVYSDCLAEVTGCPEFGPCEESEEGGTRCCSGALAECTAGYWMLDTCETVCREATPETPFWTGACFAVTGVDTCECSDTAP